MQKNILITVTPTGIMLMKIKEGVNPFLSTFN